jgi:dihydropteroate synthase
MSSQMTKAALLKWRHARGGPTPGITHCGKTTFHWGERTYVMGIVNVSPDSFSGDGLDSIDAAVAQAQRFVTEGVDILDVGGESTRPNSSPISVGEELQRVIPVLEQLKGKVELPLSVDTYKFDVARQALDAGADMLNDIWGLKQEPRLAALAADRGVPIILMSNQRDKPRRHIIPAVLSDLKKSIDMALDAGVPWENIIIDPGFGFGKTPEQNFELIRRLDELKILGRPILLGTSRKLMLDLPPEQRLESTAASSAIGIANGADIIRVHDVKEMIRVSRISDVIIRRRS